jgi:5-methylcytosine-specific restriction endonuclease McrA
MSDNRVPLRVIQEVSGHRNLEQLQTYIEVRDEQVLGAVTGLSMLSPLPQAEKYRRCGLFFRDGDKMEIDHTVPKSLGGRGNYDNLQLLHRHCHDVKTADDISTVGTQELDVDYLTQNPF